MIKFLYFCPFSTLKINLRHVRFNQLSCRWHLAWFVLLVTPFCPKHTHFLERKGMKECNLIGNSTQTARIYTHFIKNNEHVMRTLVPSVLEQCDLLHCSKTITNEVTLQFYALATSRPLYVLFLQLYILHIF